jgi:hypothetical protein
VQVLVRAPSDMLAVDVIWRVCDRDSLPDGFLRFVHAHITWLLHHVRAPLDQGEANNCWFGMPSLPQPDRLQSCSSLLHSVSSDQLLHVILHHISPHIPKPHGSKRTAEFHRGRRHPFTARRTEHKVHNVQEISRYNAGCSGGIHHGMT